MPSLLSLYSLLEDDSAGGGGDVVNLDGHTNTAFRFGANALAYFKVDGDGNMYMKDNVGSYTQIDSTADWVRPTTSAPGTYRTMFDSITGDTAFRVGWGFASTYYALTTDREMYVYDNTSASGGKTITMDYHIDDGTTEQATGVYTLTADREDF